MADQGGFSDNEILSATQPRPNKGANAGFADLGNALAGGLQQNGSVAYTKGMQIGAQTADALAQARSRVQEAQGRETAAQALENPQTQQQMGIKPEEAALLAARTRAGDSFENLASATKSFQDARMHATVADTNADPNARRAAALSLAPASGAVHAEGTNGTFVDPFASNYTSSQPGSATNTPVTVGADQHALNQSEIGLRDAQAAAAPINAAAHQTQAEKPPANGGLPPKLQTGYRFVMDSDPNSPTFNQAKMGPDGHPMQEPNPAAGSSAVGRRYNSAVVNAAALVDKEAQNVAHIGADTSRGATQMGGTHTGIMSTAARNLGLALSDDDQQEYETSLGNIGRSLATIEQAGRQPNQATVGTLDKLINNPGTSQNARLYNFGLIRQIVEAGADGMEGNDDATPAARAAYHKALDSIRSSIPYTPGDVIDFRRSKDKSPDQTFKQFMDAKNAPAGGAAAGAPTGLPDGWTVKAHPSG